MEAAWTEKLTPEEEEFLIRSLVYEVKRRGLETPMVFAIEMHKPLAGLAETSAIVLTPFLAPFIGITNVQGYGRLFSSRQSIEKILLALEDPTEAVKPVRPKSLTEEGNDGNAMKSNDSEVTTGV
ncbi:MAG: hypothetical protein ACKVQS_12435 [Fimbriimonadaceae bacterium]